jgi:hypothetical protein
VTEAQAWRTIGEAFEARVEHPDLVLDPEIDLAGSGLCWGTRRLQEWDQITRAREQQMDAKSYDAVRDSRGDSFMDPSPKMPGGHELRATLAYLFAEAAK